MADIVFPASPTVGQEFTAAGVTYEFDGVRWRQTGAAIPSTGIGDNSVTSLKIADGTIVDADIAAAAAINIAKLGATGPRNATTFLSGDGTWKSPPGAGGGGGSSPVYVVSGLVPNSEASSSANRTAIQSALDVAGAAGGGRAGLTGAGVHSGAWRVMIPEGNYFVDNAVVVPNGVILSGMSLGSRLTLRSGVGTNAGPKSLVTFSAGAALAGVETITLHGNRLNQTSTQHQCHGVNFSRATNTGELSDGVLWAYNVVAAMCEGGGFFEQGANPAYARVINCAAVSCYWSVRMKSEFQVLGFHSNNAQAAGMSVYQGSGFVMAGVRSQGSGNMEFDIDHSKYGSFHACEARDFGAIAGVGFTASSFMRGEFMIDGCRTAGEQTGLWVIDDALGGLCHHLDIAATVAGETGTAVKYAVTTRRLGEQVKLKVQPGTITTAMHRSLAAPGAEAADIEIGSSRSGMQAVNYAAQVTPNPVLGKVIQFGTLTGNMLVQNPAHSVPGMEMEMHFQQDGPGDRAVTWGSQYEPGAAVSTDANARTVIRWRCVSPTLWIGV